MTFNIISDVHFQPETIINGKEGLAEIEFDFKNLKSADYLLIAGDLATSDTFEAALKKVKKDVKGKFKDIFYVYGNHDLYDFSYLNDQHRENQYVEEKLSEEIVLLGTTLWTPDPEIDEYAVFSIMNDFRMIPNWTLNDVRREYKLQSNWLRERVKHYKALGKKVIVMTHHNPRIELHPAYESYMKFLAKFNSPESWGYEASYYVTDGSCNDIKPDVWICGHHHTSPIDREIDGVRYIRNTIGYNGSWYGEPPQLKSDRWYDFIIEV